MEQKRRLHLHVCSLASHGYQQSPNRMKFVFPDVLSWKLSCAGNGCYSQFFSEIGSRFKKNEFSKDLKPHNK